MSSYNVIEQLKYEFEKDCEETCDCFKVFKSKEFIEKTAHMKILFYSKIKEFDFFVRGFFYQSKKSYKKNDMPNYYPENYTTYNRYNRYNKFNRLKRSNSASFIEMGVFSTNENIEQQNNHQEEPQYAHNQLYASDFSQYTPNNSPTSPTKPPNLITSEPLMSSQMSNSSSYSRPNSYLKH